LKTKKKKKERKITNYKKSKKKMNSSNHNQKEQLQRRHYSILEQLKQHNKDNKITFELLTSLSGSLLDGTVFDIVNHLFDLQQITERNLFNERNKISNEYSSNSL
jgi:DNA-binding transcriptional regulator GbsR (MarR family)